jgi:hypothetical protein
LVANIEGNLFTADQLCDLVQTVLARKRSKTTSTQTRLTHNQETGPYTQR